jgi:glucose/arabinose dehydrogenase/DNA-binding beta-propeller fold protein YncE
LSFRGYADIEHPSDFRERSLAFMENWMFARLLASILLFDGLILSSVASDSVPRVLATGLKSPQSVAVDSDGRILVTVAGDAGRDGAGAILRIEGGKAQSFVAGLNDPKGMVAYHEWLFVVDKNRVLKVGRSGYMKVLAGPDAFPSPPSQLTSIAVDIEKGLLYVGDAGDGRGKNPVIYRVAQGGSVDTIFDGKGRPDFGSPGALVLDGASVLLVADSKQPRVSTLKLADRSLKVSIGLCGADGIVFDRHGRLFISDGRNGAVLVVERPGADPKVFSHSFQSPSGLCLDQSGRRLLVVDTKAGTLSAVDIVVPGDEVDESPLPLQAGRAFANLKWAGWASETPDGEVVPLRPIVLTHAGDGSNRVFVATEHGVIHVFPNNQNAANAAVFLDIQKQVRYNDKENEEGFLGLAFHPKYKQNGEFYVFYTPKVAKHPHTNLLSRFRVRRDDPNRADPSSEEVLLTIEHPFYNHDGGTVCFGPDGYLYLALGDGGAANDPFGNGQNLKTLLGKILRIDVDKKEENKPYAIPKDNPFVGRSDARPEIWCYGMRNPWRFSFDRQTGVCWEADVGQELWEEINLLVAGGNYGWSIREGQHPFGAKGDGPRKDLVEPIWEYHHTEGKSITGGSVYRGQLLPELTGAYLYADYVTGAIRALRYDPAKKRVIANQLIDGPNLPVLSFGEDEAGEIYFLIVAADGRGIFGFERSSKATTRATLSHP